MTEVWAWRGPLAGRRVEIAAAEVEAATGEDGWAQKLEPGVELKHGDSNETNPAWKLPGQGEGAPPTPGNPAKAEAGDDDDDDDDEETPAKRTAKPAPSRGRR